MLCLSTGRGLFAGAFIVANDQNLCRSSFVTAALLTALCMLQTLEDKNEVLNADLAMERDQHASTRLEMSAECACVQSLTAQKAAFKLAVKVWFISELATLQELPNLQVLTVAAIAIAMVYLALSAAATCSLCSQCCRI